MMEVEHVRVSNWQTRLLAYIQELKHRDPTLNYQTFDCTHLIGGVIEALTGKNPHLEFLGNYSTPEEAAQLIRSQGHTNLGDMLVERGYPEIPVRRATLGDLVELPVPGRSIQREGLPMELHLALGMADPPYFWGVDLTGLVKGPLSSATRAFKIG